MFSLIKYHKRFKQALIQKHEKEKRDTLMWERMIKKKINTIEVKVALSREFHGINSEEFKKQYSSLCYYKQLLQDLRDVM